LEKLDRSSSRRGDAAEQHAVERHELFLSIRDGVLGGLGVAEAGEVSVEDTREMWWMTLSGSEGVFGVLGVAEKREGSSARPSVDFRRTMSSSKESLSPCETVRIMSRYASSVRARLVPCTFPKREGVLRRLGSAGRASFDLRRALGSGERSTSPSEGIMLLQLIGSRVPKR
jgi:hypothetical protein